MALLKTPALVLRATDYSETSQVVSFLTRDHGRLTALARGARRPRGAYGGGLIAPSLAEIVVSRRETRELDLLTEARLREIYPGLRLSLEKIYLSWYIIELVLKGTRAREPAAGLFAETLAALRRLERQPDGAPACLAFEGRYLDELGFRPETEVCVVCRRSVAAQPGAVSYAPLLGGIACRACARAEATGTISARGLAALRLLGKTRRPEGVVLDGRTRAEIARFLRAFIVFSLERRPTMLEYLGNMGPGRLARSRPRQQQPRSKR